MSADLHKWVIRLAQEVSGMVQDYPEDVLLELMGDINLNFLMSLSKIQAYHTLLNPESKGNSLLKRQNSWNDYVVSSDLYDISQYYGKRSFTPGVLDIGNRFNAYVNYEGIMMELSDGLSPEDTLFEPECDLDEFPEMSFIMLLRVVYGGLIDRGAMELLHDDLELIHLINPNLAPSDMFRKLANSY